MTTRDYDTRFAGIKRLYGTAAFTLFRELHICVVGIGGVGSWAAEALARSGIGRITLIDYDEICLSNTNRQIHTLSDTVGRKKIEVMAERIRLINPDSEVICIDDFLTQENYQTLLSAGYDAVIDAIDSIKFKAMMIHYCKRQKLPVIVTGGAGGLTDPSAIKVADLSRSYNDPLLSRVRRRLREEYGFSRNTKRSFGIECVFSSQQPLYPKADGTVCHAKPGIHGISLDCNLGYGASTVVTASFGFVAVSRAIAKVLKKRLA
jgi:tRNA A37 threonylcarbamoyladenosine dehydratase